MSVSKHHSTCHANLQPTRLNWMKPKHVPCTHQGEWPGNGRCFGLTHGFSILSEWPARNFAVYLEITSQSILFHPWAGRVFHFSWSPPPCLPCLLHFWDGISFLIIASPPPVSPLFLHWISCRSLSRVKPWVEGVTKIRPALSYHLVHPYFGKALDLRLYPTHNNLGWKFQCDLDDLPNT